MRDLIDELFDYAESFSGPVPPYLDEVERQTFLKTIAPQMMSGKLQGRLLALLAKLLQPRSALEIGTFTGYATLCLAEGLASGGVLHTIEGDPEHAAIAARHIGMSPYHRQIELHVGDARELLADLPADFDLVFLDGDKIGYPAYYELLIDRIRPGGLLLADNVLWDGKTPKKTADRVVESLRQYNRLLREDTRVE
ncbi:MAG: O-methyltransferase, partial [Lewinella sp.]